ncbi:MAG: L-lactate permease [Bacillota bacterium]
MASVVGFAYVTNSSGMSTTLGMSLAMTGSMFAFASSGFPEPSRI